MHNPWTFFALAALAAGCTFAETGTNMLPPVVVTASPITQEETVGKDGADRVVIGGKQINRLNAMDLQTAVRQVPGVMISRFQPIGAYGGGDGGSVYIRGLGAARPGSELRIYTDGVPKESGIWEHPLLDSVPVDFADTVTINKNPQPQAYPGTFASLDIETRRRYTPGFEGEADFTFGRYNTYIGSVSQGGKIDDFDYYGGAAYKSSDGTRDHAKSSLWDLFGRVGWDLSAHDHLGYVYQRTDSWVRDPGPWGTKPPVHDEFDLSTDTHGLRLDSDHEDFKGYSLLYFQDGKIDWFKDHLTDGNSQSPAGIAKTDWYNYGYRGSYDFLVDDYLTLTAGLEAWSEGGRTRNKLLANGRTVWGFEDRYYGAAPYLGARYDIPLSEEWTLTPSAGMRYYEQSEFDNEWAPVGALTLSHEDDLDIFVNYSRGVHYPGVYMSGTSLGTYDTLAAETLDTAEAGAKVKIDDVFSVLGAVFHNEANDRMEQTTRGYVNSGDMRANGAEVSLHASPVKRVTFFAGTAYTHAETEPVSRLPEWTGTLGASWQMFQYLRWDVDAEYIGSQYAYSVRTAAPRLRELNDAVLCNTRLALNLRSFLPIDGEIFVAVEDFTDQGYSYYPDYPMGGILWYTGMKLKF